MAAYSKDLDIQGGYGVQYLKYWFDEGNSKVFCLVVAPMSVREDGAMDRQELRQIQAPLKARYRENPTAALITLSAVGALDDVDIACSIATGQALVKAGLHPLTGGSGSLACSGDLLLQALVACAGVTLRSVATSLDIPVTGRIRAEGDLDFRGTLGVDKQVPVGFQAIRLIFELDSSVPQDQMDTLLQLTERYCVVYQTLASGAAMTTILNRAE